MTNMNSKLVLFALMVLIDQINTACIRNSPLVPQQYHAMFNPQHYIPPIHSHSEIYPGQAPSINLNPYATSVAATASAAASSAASSSFFNTGISSFSTGAEVPSGACKNTGVYTVGGSSSTNLGTSLSSMNSFMLGQTIPQSDVKVPYKGFEPICVDVPPCARNPGTCSCTNKKNNPLTNSDEEKIKLEKESSESVELNSSSESKSASDSSEDPNNLPETRNESSESSEPKEDIKSCETLKGSNEDNPAVPYDELKKSYSEPIKLPSEDYSPEFSALYPENPSYFSPETTYPSQKNIEHHSNPSQTFNPFSFMSHIPYLPQNSSNASKTPHSCPFLSYCSSQNENSEPLKKPLSQPSPCKSCKLFTNEQPTCPSYELEPEIKSVYTQSRKPIKIEEPRSFHATFSQVSESKNEERSQYYSYVSQY